MNAEAAASNRTVYVLGAGSSYKANVPLQADILNHIKDMDALDAFGPFQDSFAEHRGRAIAFVNRLFNASPNPTLEDVFTLLDQSISSKNYCYGYDYRTLETVRDSFYRTIVMLFFTYEERMTSAAQAFYEVLATYFMGERLKAGLEQRRLSIISLNWDCVIENSVYSCMERLETTALDIDYCCYTYAMGGSDRHRSSILQKAMGLLNIKLMKLHGSVNWVVCPNCKRLYVGLGVVRAVIAEHIVGKSCPACSSAFSDACEDWQQPYLEPFIVSPTFVKQFDNAHIQMIWHNAYMDLCRADKVVFIGYSLPEADYHVRTLLKRAVRAGTRIDVVLVKGDRAPQGHEYDSVRCKYAATRYEAFFGGGEHVNYYYDGVEGYFSDICGGASLDDRLAEMKKEHKAVLEAFPLSQERNSYTGEESPSVREQETDDPLCEGADDVNDAPDGDEKQIDPAGQ